MDRRGYEEDGQYNLGSMSAMSYADGANQGDLVADSLGRYLPFGGLRQDSGSQPLDGGGLSDRGFTGHYENRDLGLTYMQARYFDSLLRRFVSADTIVPEPGSSMGYNRYAYVSQNPVVCIDPTGNWDCVQDSNYDECVAKIDAWLALLEHSGGDVSLGLYLWFLEYDQGWIEQNGVGVLFEFKEMGGAAVPICGGATGLCAAFRDGPKVNITDTYLGFASGLEAKSRAALFAHELVHLHQGDRFAWSIVGEAEAYYVQGLIRRELTGLSDNDSFTELVGHFDDGVFTGSEVFEYAEFLRDWVSTYNFSRMYPNGTVHFAENKLPFVTDAASEFSRLGWNGRADRTLQGINEMGYIAR